MSCKTIKNDQIIGSWQAVEVLEDGEPLKVNLSEINISFNANELYSFKSTLNYNEAGRYYIESPFLFTTDTVNSASTEKTVEILLLTADSLHLKMSEGGKNRLMKMKKLK